MSDLCSIYSPIDISLSVMEDVVRVREHSGALVLEEELSEKLCVCVCVWIIFADGTCMDTLSFTKSTYLTKGTHSKIEGGSYYVSIVPKAWRRGYYLTQP